MRLILNAQLLAIGVLAAALMVQPQAAAARAIDSGATVQIERGFAAKSKSQPQQREAQTQHLQKEREKLPPPPPPPGPGKASEVGPDRVNPPSADPTTAGGGKPTSPPSNSECTTPPCPR